MKPYLFIGLLLLLFVSGCNYSKCNFEKNQVLLNDSLENELLKLKNQTFCDCYYKATRNASTKITPPDGSNYLQISDLVQRYCNDSRLINIIEDWNKKNYFSYSKENKLYLMRCLDLYNSKELKHYIDSIREIELKKIKIPVSAQVQH